jgi:hypothetical protein
MNNPKATSVDLVSLLKTFASSFKSIITRFQKWVLRRDVIANLLMLCFILNTAIGASMIYAPAGFIVAGVACFAVGILLGLE